MYVYGIDFFMWIPISRIWDIEFSNFNVIIILIT